MRFCYVTLTFLALLTLCSALFLPTRAAPVNNPPELTLLPDNAGFTYTGLNRCKLTTDSRETNDNVCQARGAIANANNCSPEGIRFKRRFKLFVEHIKAEYVTGEAKRDTSKGEAPVARERWFKK